MTEQLTFPNDVTPLDRLLWLRFKSEVPGLVEATLDQNYGLADLGPLPLRGTAVTVTPPVAPVVTLRKTIQLYD